MDLRGSSNPAQSYWRRHRILRSVPRIISPIRILISCLVTPGIVLFTYHKYLKSIESPVPLDGHGNPIVGVEIDTATLGSIGLHENRQLNGHDYSLVRVPRCFFVAPIQIFIIQDAVQDPLFSAGPGSDSGDEDHRKTWVPAQHTNGGAVVDDTHSVVRESMDVERLWDDEQRERARTQNT